MQWRWIRTAAVVLLLAAGWTAPGAAQEPEGAPEHVPTDYLTFAAGAVPIRIGGSGAGLGADFEEAVEAIDGGYGRFGVNARPGDADTNTEFVYELPAPTTFERFAVPNVLETPSPHQTFVRELHIEGSATREPIARNDTESGRSLNRRVEVECAG